MSRPRRFYGFRYFGSKHTTWAGTCEVAGELVAFDKEYDLSKWICKETYSGSLSGSRKRVSRKQAIGMVGIETLKKSLEHVNEYET